MRKFGTYEELFATIDLCLEKTKAMTSKEKNLVCFNFVSNNVAVNRGVDGNMSIRWRVVNPVTGL